MSIRNDITVNWDLSPRIIEVAITSTSLDMQDLVDTIRFLEYDMPNLDMTHLLNCSGKEALGGGILVAITVQLLNAKIKFADRGGPSYIQCTVGGGNLVAVDENGDEMDAIQSSNYTQVIVLRSSAGVIAETGVSGLTQEESDQLLAIPTNPLTTSKFLALK